MTDRNPARLDAQLRWYAATIPFAGAVVADVGANVGRLSQFFAEAVGDHGRVVSIEPLAENVAAIRERIAACNAADRWTIEACAASGRKGSATLALFRTPEGEWNSRVVAAKGGRKVPMRPLSALAPDATVVKLDIEGHEYEVLEEALPRLECAHSWAIELHAVPGVPLQHALGLLMAHGYRVYAGARRSDDATGEWIGEEIAATLDWSAIAPTRLRADGSAFKMLHVIARREVP